ncbi:hypothetical protein GUG51_13515, partial [Xanthomonas citri pv. citri]|nr:hypothetical protein [Xanthomonas citri pv. citri]
AIATAKDMGIMEGSGGLFMPESSMSRQDAMVMLQRALRAAGWSVASGSSTNLNLYSDGWLISDYAREAVGAMVAMGMM